MTKDFHKYATVKELPQEEPVEIPSKIGPYQIESLFRKGSMSLLYLGLDPVSRKTILIKVLSPEFVNREGMVRQFLQEAEIIKITSHPNIVDLYGHGEWEGGLYIAMEFIQGVSLRQFISQHSLSLRRCLEIILQVAYALCHLHTHGIIHRDLKPENILITEEGVIKVIDFGISQLHEETSEEQEKSGFIGTPDYMSPEQKENPKKASFTSDIYSLGIITYELVIGKLSYGMIHLSLLPKELRKIVEKAIAVSKDERYPDIVNFISDISQYLKSGAIEKERPGTDQWKELLEELQKAELTLNSNPNVQWSVDLGVAKSKAPGQLGLFYELVTLKNQHHCILMWESPVEGVQASVFGAMLRGIIQTVSKDTPLEKFLETIQSTLRQDHLQLQFNMCLLELSPWDNKLRYFSMKMGSLLLFSDRTNPHPLVSDNFPLGHPNQEFIETTDNWNVGDTLVFYSEEDPSLLEMSKKTLGFSPQRQAEGILAKIIPQSDMHPQKKPKTLFVIQRIA